MAIAAKSSPSIDASYSGDRLLIFTAIWIPILIICVALRYLARWIIKGPWRRDDALIFFSLFLQLGQAGVSIASVRHAGVGRHVLYLEATDPTKVTIWYKYLVAITFVYLAGINIPKFAILSLYDRLFPVTHMRHAIHLIMAFLIMFTLSLLIADLAACRPFAGNWNPNIQATCVDREAFFRWSSIPNIISDIIILILPMPVIWNLHASRRIKVGLTLTLAVGSFGIITSIIRFANFFQENSFVDGTWSAVDLTIWTQIEPGVYLICACIPTWRPLIDRIGTNFSIKLANRRRSTGMNTTNDVNGDGFNIPLKSNVSIKGQGFQLLEDSRNPAATNDIVVTKGFSIIRIPGEHGDPERRQG